MNMLIDVLIDLIAIDNDRIVAYERIERVELMQHRFNPIFHCIIDDSRGLTLDLATEITALHVDAKTSTTTSGKIYRVWMDVKAVFTGHDRHTVLENCEANEDTAQKAYKMAIDDEGLTGNLLDLVAQQKASLKASHDQIKMLRDAGKNA